MAREKVTEVQKCQKEMDKIERQISRNTKRRYELHSAKHVAWGKLRRAELKCLIGQQVMIDGRYPENDEDAWLNDAVGILLKVFRTRVLVDHGDRGNWRMPYERIQAAGGTQGFIVRLGGV